MEGMDHGWERGSWGVGHGWGRGSWLGALVMEGMGHGGWAWVMVIGNT